MLNNQLLGLIHQELSNDNLENVKKLSNILCPPSKFSSMDFNRDLEKILFEKTHYKLKKTSINDLILLIQNDSFSKDKTSIQDKIINFFINDEIKSYSDVNNMESLEYEFECRKLERPDFKYIKYEYKNRCRDEFAKGDLSEEYGREEVEIIYKIGNGIHFIRLDLGYKCKIEHQKGGVNNYETEVLHFYSSQDQDKIKQDVIIASHVICCVTKIATIDVGCFIYFYNHIFKYLKLD